MKKIFHALTIVVFSVSSLFASDFSKFQGYAELAMPPSLALAALFPLETAEDVEALCASGDQTLNAKDLIKDQNIEFTLPPAYSTKGESYDSQEGGRVNIPSPVKLTETKTPAYSKFDYSGIPTCIFTEETNITPILV